MGDRFISRGVLSFFVLAVFLTSLALALLTGAVASAEAVPLGGVDMMVGSGML